MEISFKRENYCDQSAVKYQPAPNPLVHAPNDSYKAVSDCFLVISSFCFVFFFFSFFWWGMGAICFVLFGEGPVLTAIASNSIGYSACKC